MFHCSYLYPRICISREKKISSSGRQLASPRDPPRAPRARNSGDESIVRRYRGKENHCGGKIIARNSNVNARGRQWPPRVNVVTLLAAFSAQRVQLTILWFETLRASNVERLWTADFVSSYKYTSCHFLPSNGSREIGKSNFLSINLRLLGKIETGLFNHLLEEGEEADGYSREIYFKNSPRFPLSWPEIARPILFEKSPSSRESA